MGEKGIILTKSQAYELLVNGKVEDNNLYVTCDNFEEEQIDFIKVE